MEPMKVGTPKTPCHEHDIWGWYGEVLVRSDFPPKDTHETRYES